MEFKIISICVGIILIIIAYLMWKCETIDRDIDTDRNKYNRFMDKYKNK